MNRNLEFLKKPLDAANKVIFLDIRGVLQPTDNQERFDHNLDEVVKMVAEKYHDDNFFKLDKYDVGAVYYDWDNISVGILHQLLRDTNSHFVISSDWRDFNDLESLKTLFKLHNLDEYIVGVCDPDELGSGDQRVKFINKYLDEHPIDKYAVIDDLYLFTAFGERFRQSDIKLSIDDYYYLKMILNYDISFSDENNVFSFNDDFNIHYDIDFIDNKEVMILKTEKLKRDYYKYYLEYLLNYLIIRRNIDLYVFDNSMCNFDDLKVNGYRGFDSNYYVYKDRYCSRELNEVIKQIRLKGI